MACHELNARSGVHSVRRFHFRMDHATVLRDLGYRRVLFRRKAEYPTIRQGQIPEAHDSFSHRWPATSLICERLL